MSFKSEMDSIMKDGSLGKESVIVSYKTGIDIFDYVNGYVRSDGNLALGVPSSRVFMNIGESGSGKSTLAIQQACKIVEPYENGFVFHLDYERSTNKERVLALSGWTEEEYNNKYKLLSSGIYAETLYNLVKNVSNVKNNNFDKYAVDSDIKNSNGEYVKILPPTVILLDSVAMMAPKEIEDDDELKGSMGATAIAKTNTNIMKRILTPMEEGNIILILINHITTKIDINPMAKTKAQINYLKQNESIPGGKAISYLANTLLKIETSSKLEEDKEFGIKGFYLTGEIIKSRSNRAGVKFKMVYDQVNGVDNILTNYVFMKDQKRIAGAGRGYYLDIYDKVKFTQKAFKETYLNNEEFREIFDRELHNELIKFIPENFSEKNYNDVSELNYEGMNFNEVEDKLKFIQENLYIDDNDNYYEVDNNGILILVEVEDDDEF